MSKLNPRAIRWVLDWDGTITRCDTLDALVKIATEAKPDSSVLQDWSRVTTAYVSDYDVTFKRLVPNGRLPTTVDKEKTLLKALEDVEQRSIDRVSESGIFRDLSVAQLESGAAKAVETGNVQLREGYEGFLQRIQSTVASGSSEKDYLSILSVNWSRRFIAACLEAAKVDLGQPVHGRIYANELEGIDHGRPSSGQISPAGDMKIISSHDKIVWLERLRELGTNTAMPVVYVGDSWTDFECLLAADWGICIRDDPVTSTQKKLLNCFERLGIQCPHIRDLARADEYGVVWARDFREVEDYAPGLHFALLKSTS